MANFCTNCGAPLSDAAKFCTACGAKRAEPQPVPAPVPVPVTPVQQQPYAQPPAAAKKKLKPPVLIGAAAALVVAVIAIIAFSAKKDGPGPSVPGGTTSAGNTAAHADPVNDPKSTKALTGSWHMFMSASPLSAAETVVFREDGTFDIYYFLSVSSSYTGWDGYRYSYNASATQSFRKGNFRVRGNSIEFYNVEKATDTAFSSGWEHEQNRIDASDKLRNLPKSYYVPAESFVWLFEFYDANNLRLMNDTGGDWDFAWDEEKPHNADIPAHMLPEPAWPTENISPDLPRFNGVGRLREVGKYYPDEEETDEHRTYYITVYRTTKEAAYQYAQALSQVGWLLESPDFDPSARKGLYRLSFYIRDNEFKITYRKDKQGVWPTEWFGDAVYPPEDCEIIGEINTEYWEKKEYFSLTVDCAGVDAAAFDRYFTKLKGDGFANCEGYGGDKKLYKFARVNGDMYRIYMEQYRIELDIATINYTMQYYSDAVWPSAKDIPPGFLPPDGCSLLDKIEIYEGGSGYYSFSFECGPMDEAAVARYFLKLEGNGWMKDDDSWGEDSRRIKTAQWNGAAYDCAIAFYGINDGLARFEAKFSKP